LLLTREEAAALNICGLPLLVWFEVYGLYICYYCWWLLLCIRRYPPEWFGCCERLT
jgi:hypothetical protein